MSVSTIIVILLKVFGGVITAGLQRIFSHKFSSLQGAGVGAAVLGFIYSIGCDLTAAQQGIIAGMAALPGLLGTDPSTTAKSFLQVASEKAILSKSSQ